MNIIPEESTQMFINIKIFTMNNTSFRQIGEKFLSGASPLKGTEL